MIMQASLLRTGRVRREEKFDEPVVSKGSTLSEDSLSVVCIAPGRSEELDSPKVGWNFIYLVAKDHFSGR
jgi:hypothetical protein